MALALRRDGRLTQAGEPRSFRASPVGQGSLPAADRAVILAFHQQTSRLQRAVLGASQTLGEVETRLGLLRRAIDATPGAPPALAENGRALAERLRDLRTRLNGDQTIANRSEPIPPPITARVQRIVFGTWSSTSAPTATHRRSYEIAAREFGELMAQLRPFIDDVKKLEEQAEAAGAPWTPGRVPSWKP